MKEGVECVGIDISETAIKKARNLHKNCKFEICKFNNFEFYKKNKINVFLLTEITWFILPELDDFLKKIKLYSNECENNIYLIHFLTTFDKGIQKYGNEYFTNQDEILDYFDLNF